MNGQQESKTIKHYYLHADLDAFFASVEQLDNPQYRGKPVIVGGKPQDRRSVVSTASYEARKYGVHSAMPVAKAYQLCPNGIYVHGRMKRYSELSYQIMNIFKDFSPDVQQLSIDEAFIDLTGTEGLFGAPEQTAMKIKERVKKETGLTVSIGLAPTKYLAKIASDMNKPDGFYKIEHGQEQEFMLKLPLKKVWGIGDKTLDALKHSGLNTTRDIFEKSLDALVFMYGQNTGSFLYNTVRGIETVNFDRKTKSHSISNETTFPYDVTDTYTAETCILELCHSVIFRLLKENGFSQTVMVKIRYEDFSTVSIQQKFNYSILTLDSLYNAAKELFERKYEKGRGIRLIGIALENIENTEKPVQQSLFDDGSEKKQNVEKAILKLEKKHPDIKIHKARMLENLGRTLKCIAGILFCIYGLFTGSMAYAQEAQAEYLTGYWQGILEGSVDSTFGFGNSFALSPKQPVFKQEVDISTLIHITPHSYFELEFLDEFKHNTYTFGYNNDSWLKEFKFSNRGIVFPAIYSSTISGYNPGGGQNEAPGIMLHFEDIKAKKWTADLMLRYDMTQARSAVFYGSNSVKDSQTELSSFLHSKAFYIPSQVISQIKEVYIQSNYGTATDSKGISYQKLLKSDYVISQTENILVLCASALENIPKGNRPYILLTFYSDTDCETLLLDTGTWSDSQSFAGKLQSYFNSNKSAHYELSAYCKISQDNLITQIDGQKAFIIQSPYAFSPYAFANLYDISTDSGNNSSSFLITDRYSQNQSEQYFVNKILLDFSEYTAVTNSNQPGSFADPQCRFPLADKYPELYLGNASTIPLVLINRTLTPVKNYDIGKKASAGSVRVYKNGILETGAIYDSDTGFVKLPFVPGELEKIYITWNEESNNIENGAFSTGAGFIYNFTPDFFWDISYTGQYPLLNTIIDGKTFAISHNPKSSFSAFTTGLTYNKNIFSVNDTLSAAFENENITGILMVNVPSQPGTKKNKIEPADITKVQPEKMQTGAEPYSLAIDINLSDTENLYKASSFEMELLCRSPELQKNADSYEVILELGVNSQTLKDSCPKWQITSVDEQGVITPFDLSSNKWQTVKILLTDTDRAKLRHSKDARLIIQSKQNNNHSISRLLSSASFTQLIEPSSSKTIIQNVFVSSTNNLLVMSQTSYAGQSNVQKEYPLLKAGAAELYWSSLYEQLDSVITAVSYFEEADFSFYKSVNFDFAINKPVDFTFLLETINEQKALEVTIKKEALQHFTNESTQYLTLTADTILKKIYINGQEIAPENYSFFINPSIVPCVQKITLQDGQDGYFAIAPTYYKNIEPQFSVKNNLTFTVGNNDSAGLLQAQSVQGIVLKNSKKSSDFINANIKGSYTLWGIIFSAAADTAGKSANHSINTKTSLLNFLDFGENYSFTAGTTTTVGTIPSESQKNDYVKITTGNFYKPFSITMDAQADSKKGFSTQEQKYSTGLQANVFAGKATFTAKTQLFAAQKNSVVKNNLTDTGKAHTDFLNYFYTWLDNSKYQFGNGTDAQSRDIKFISTLQAALPFANLSPSVSLELNENKNFNIENGLYSADIFTLSLPFSLKNNAFSINFKHNSLSKNKLNNQTLRSYGNYSDDIKELFANQKNSGWFYIPFPVDYKKLPSPGAKEALISLSDSMQYDFLWRRKLFNDLKDLFIPLSANASFTRDLLLTDKSVSNTFILKGQLSNSFINLFGANSSIQLYNWYKQEEYSGTLSASVRFTKEAPKNPVFVIESKEKLLFYIHDSNTWSIQTELSFDNKKNWKVNVSSSWERQSPASLLKSLTNLVWQKSKEMELKTNIKDSLSLMLSRQDKINRQTYKYLRNAQLNIQSNHSVFSGAGISFGFEQNKTLRLGLEYSLGVKISF